MNDQKPYFMEVLGKDPEEVEAVLIGCRRDGHRLRCLDLAEAKAWRYSHESEYHDGKGRTGIDYIVDDPEHDTSYLTEEIKVLRSQGLDTKEIAQLMGMTTHTVLNRVPVGRLTKVKPPKPVKVVKPPKPPKPVVVKPPKPPKLVKPVKVVKVKPVKVVKVKPPTAVERLRELMADGQCRDVVQIRALLGLTPIQAGMAINELRRDNTITGDLYAKPRIYRLT